MKICNIKTKDGRLVACGTYAECASTMNLTLNQMKYLIEKYRKDKNSVPYDISIQNFGSVLLSKIIKLRLKGYPIEYIAKQCDVTRQTIYNILNASDISYTENPNNHNISEEEIKAIEMYLNDESYKSIAETIKYTINSVRIMIYRIMNDYEKCGKIMDIITERNMIKYNDSDHVKDIVQYNSRIEKCSSMLLSEEAIDKTIDSCKDLIKVLEDTKSNINNHEDDMNIAMSKLQCMFDMLRYKHIINYDDISEIKKYIAENIENDIKDYIMVNITK